jgi:FkbM family methyltransferase
MKKLLKQLLFKFLNYKQINTLRKIKWFFLAPFTNDQELISQFYSTELEIRILEQLLPKYFSQYQKKTILDIGANIGGYSYYLAPIASQFSGTCIAFEPGVQIYNRLTKNIEQCNFISERIALSNTNGFGDLYLPVSQGCSSLIKHPEFDGLKTESVALMRLDDYIKKNAIDNIGFIKIDVEGHEFEVIEGAVETINKFSPLILCESENRHIINTGRSTEMFLEHMKELQYNAYVISTDLKILSVTEIEIPKNRNCQVEYYYNYWLVPRNLDRHFHLWFNDLSTQHSTG